MSTEIKTGIRALMVLLVGGLVAFIVGWVSNVDEKQGRDSERIAKIETVVPRIDKALEAISASQVELRKDVAAEIQALRTEIKDAGPNWGRALRPARGRDGR